MYRHLESMRPAERKRSLLLWGAVLAFAVCLSVASGLVGRQLEVQTNEMARDLRTVLEIQARATSTKSAPLCVNFADASDEIIARTSSAVAIVFAARAVKDAFSVGCYSHDSAKDNLAALLEAYHARKAKEHSRFWLAYALGATKARITGALTSEDQVMRSNIFTLASP